MIVPRTFNILSKETYDFSGSETLRTPALLIYPEIVDRNIRSMLALLDGDANLWRPHLKTAKISSMIKKYIDHGINQFKCATTLELRNACVLGASDVLLAMPVTGANAIRVREIAKEYSRTEISVLCEDPRHLNYWEGSSVGIFIDIDPGMNRTGISKDNIDEILNLLTEIKRQRLRFRGLHYYDGHLANYDIQARTKLSHKCYDHLIKIIHEVRAKDNSKFEVITSGTPTFPCALEFEDLKDSEFLHRISPGTIIYCDCSTMNELPESYGFKPAAIVLSSVVSHPLPARITCDAGHKTVSADSGVPTCLVVGHPNYKPSKPSEEHLPIDLPDREKVPGIGENLFLLPRHICPTVNNFDHVVLIKDHKITGLERVDSRGREQPVPH